MNIIKTEHINTNNAWGFAGKIGTLTTYDNGVEVFKGKAYYRHGPPSVCNYVSIEVLPKFSIGLRDLNGSYLNTLKGVKTISIFSSEHGTHWRAIASDLDEFEMYGESYKLIRKVVIE